MYKIILRLGRLFFHPGVTDSVCMFYRYNELTLSQQLITRGILPIISYKWYMQTSVSIYLHRSPIYEFWSAGAPVTMPHPFMNWVPHFDSSIYAANMIPRFSLYDLSLPARMVLGLKSSFKIFYELLVAMLVTSHWWICLERQWGRLVFGLLVWRFSTQEMWRMGLLGSLSWRRWLLVSLRSLMRYLFGMCNFLMVWWWLCVHLF